MFSACEDNMSTRPRFSVSNHLWNIEFIHTLYKQCRRKHSYVCPLFEATGMCPQGSKCKLHHPKSRNKSKKRKSAEMQSNSRGRYFGSKILKIGEPLVVASYKCDSESDADPFCCGGHFAEFISIDVGSDNDGVETSIPKDSDTKEVESSLSDMLLDELDVLIKPVRIMNKANNSLTTSIVC